MCACRIVPISSSLCVLKGCKLTLFNSCFFLSLGPLSPTSKEIKYEFFLLLFYYIFKLRYSKTTSTVRKVVHPASTWCIRPSSVPARPNISNVAYYSVIDIRMRPKDKGPGERRSAQVSPGACRPLLILVPRATRSV